MCFTWFFFTNVTILCIQISPSPYISHHNQQYFIVCDSPECSLNGKLWMPSQWFVKRAYLISFCIIRKFRVLLVLSMRHMQNHRIRNCSLLVWFPSQIRCLFSQSHSLHSTLQEALLYRNSSQKNAVTSNFINALARTYQLEDECIFFYLFVSHLPKVLYLSADFFIRW